MRGTHDPDVVHHRRWVILGVLNLSLVLVVAANSSLNVALPTLVRELGATHAELQWIIDAYALVFAGLLLPMGALGDRFGRKGMLQTGLVIFAGAAFGGSLATAPWHVIATRAVMGVGAAMIMPATLSIITNVFPPHERARAIAVWAGFAGAGASIGPIISGALLEEFWYGSVFFINLPIVALALGLGLVLVPTSSDPQHRALDPVGGVLSMTGLGALIYAIIQGPERGWTDPLIVAAFVFGGAVVSGFVAWERRSDHPMLPMEQFRDARFSMGAGAIGLVFLGMFGFFFVTTQYLQFVLGYSPLRAGTATLPMAMAMVVTAPRSAALAERFGRKQVMATGMLLVAGGMTVMSQLAPESIYLQLVPGLVFLGAGMALSMAPATGAIMESMPLAKAGVGSAVNDTTREVGGALGIAVLGSLLSSGYRSAIQADLSQVSSLVHGAARESIGGALAMSQRLPSRAGALLSDAARHAFTDAMSTVFLAAAVVALLSAGLVMRFMPRGGASMEAHPDDPATGGAHARRAASEPLAGT